MFALLSYCCLGCTDDQDPTRFLLGDETGHLHVLALEVNDSEVVGLSMDTLGQTSIASNLCYLDNGVVFVGSRFGDSQLVKLLPEPVRNLALVCCGLLLLLYSHWLTMLACG